MIEQSKLFDTDNAGKTMHQWAKDLWPINRSLTGQGVRDTFAYLADILPNLQQHSVKTGSQVFDWQIPQEWHCNDAYIVTPKGNKICQFKQHNLHLVGYSEPINKTLTLEQLKPHLHTLPEQPEVIPYVTSYYKRTWGFCLSHNDYLALEDGDYQVVIDSELFDGELNYADCMIKGRSNQQILLSTNVCHPMLANNELSGPIMVAALGKWLSEQPDLYYSYRLVFLPETIGAVAYLSEYKDELMDKVVGGYQVICCGDERAYSYNASPYGDNISDNIAIEMLTKRGTFDRYSFLSRGADERQYCAPNIRLPIASICRSKYALYPEYHNSGDDLNNVVTPKGLQQTFELYQDCLLAFEHFRPQKQGPQKQLPQQQPSNRKIIAGNPVVNVYCEPQLGKRGLYDNLNDKDHPLNGISSRTIINVITYCDGSNTAADIAQLIAAPLIEVEAIIDQLDKQGLLGIHNGQ